MQTFHLVIVLFYSFTQS